jgi:hypothetical protein
LGDLAISCTCTKDNAGTHQQFVIILSSILYLLDTAKWNPKLPEVFTVASQTNEPVKFVLHVIANPPPTAVTWFHPSNQAAIGKGYIANKVNDATYTLSKNSIGSGDYGKYTVKVTNAVGSSDFIFELLPRGMCL